MLQAQQLAVAEPFHMYQLVARRVHRANQLVELELNHLAVPVLRVLNQEYHQEGDDRRAGVDHELPGIAESEDRTGQRPYDHDADGDGECPWAADGVRDTVRETTEHLVHRGRRARIRRGRRCGGHWVVSSAATWWVRLSLTQLPDRRPRLERDNPGPVAGV